jgi:hypothetical protein
MANDLPVMLAGASRARIPYRDDPVMLLYFLDQNAFPPEPPGMWIAGGKRANVIVRTEVPMDHLVMTAESPIATELTVSVGGKPAVVRLAPGKPARFDVEARGVRAYRSYAYLLTAVSAAGFVPHLQDPASDDGRYLGAVLQFAGVPSIHP